MINLIHGDAILEMAKLNDKSIDMIFVDPPQGITKNPWDKIIPFESLWLEYKRIIKDRGIIIIMTNQPFTSAMVMSQPNLFKYSMVWQKNNPSGFLNAKKMPLRSHEDILIFYKKTPAYYPQKTTGHPRKVSSAHHKRNSKKTDNYGAHKLAGYDSTERYPKSILNFAADTQKTALNATQKPVNLIEWFLKSYSKEGDLILDHCAGSGSTGEACTNTGRNCILIEKDQQEFNKAKNRLKL